MVSGGKGNTRTLCPLPRTRNCDSASSRSASFRPSTSRERNPFNSISATIARSRAVRKLDQKRATCSTPKGTITRCGTFSFRSAPAVPRGLP